MEAIKGTKFYQEGEVKRYNANREAAKRRIPHLKEDIASIKAMIPKEAVKASPGVTMKDISGAKIKKATGADLVRKEYHNKNLQGGNFGIMIRDGKKLYDLRGYHDPDGVVYNLSFEIGAFGRYGSFGSIITKSNYKTMTPAKIYAILADGIKKGKKIEQR